MQYSNSRLAWINQPPDLLNQRGQTDLLSEMCVTLMQQNCDDGGAACPDANSVQHWHQVAVRRLYTQMVVGQSSISVLLVVH